MVKYKVGDRVAASIQLAGVAVDTEGTVCAIWTNLDTDGIEKVSVKWDTGVKTTGLIQWRAGIRPVARS